jgi:hypothetical protein
MGSVVEAIARKEASLDQRNMAAEFSRLARIKLKHGSNLLPGELRESEDFRRSTPRIQKILTDLTVRAPVAAGTTTGVGTQLTEYKNIMEAWASSLIGSGSIFDTVKAAGALPVPLRQRVVAITAAPTPGSPAELSQKLVSELSLVAGQLEPVKATALVALSDELAQFSEPSALAIFETELRTAIVREVDSRFLSYLVSQTTPQASAGATAANQLTDHTTMLNLLDVSSTSRIFRVVSVARAQTLAPILTSGGDLLYPNYGPRGGLGLMQVEMLTSNSVPANREVWLVADRIAIADEGIEVRPSRQATIQMNTTPDSPPTGSTVAISLWQHNLWGLLCERFFAAFVRGRGVASLSF